MHLELGKIYANLGGESSAEPLDALDLWLQCIARRRAPDARRWVPLARGDATAHLAVNSMTRTRTVRDVMANSFVRRRPAWCTCNLRNFDTAPAISPTTTRCWPEHPLRRLIRPAP